MSSLSKGVGSLVLPIDACRAAEQAVIDGLEQQGFAIAEWDKAAPGPTDLRAVKHGASGSEDRKLLIQVRAAIFPEEPPSLTADEVKRLQSRCQQTGDEPWEVRAYLDGTYRVVGPPQWRFLKDA
jgi:hypothetical protein